MINMEHLADVKQRIIEIEDRVNSLKFTPVKSADFAGKLAQEIAKVTKPATNLIDKIQEQDATRTTKEIPKRTQVTMDDLRLAEAKENAAAVTAPESVAGASSVTQTSVDGSVNSLLSAAAAKFGVDPRLVNAVAQVESGKNQRALSGAGAIGVMQLMPQTAASLGVDPYDLKENIEGGAKYLRNLLDNFGGNVEKAVAAYNAGLGAVKKYDGVPPYKETQNYVKQVLDIYQ